MSSRRRFLYPLSFGSVLVILIGGYSLRKRIILTPEVLEERERQAEASRLAAAEFKTRVAAEIKREKDKQ